MNESKSSESLDLLNFHVKELREPKYKKVQAESENSYKKSYLPNGKQVEYLSLDE